MAEDEQDKPSTSPAQNSTVGNNPNQIVLIIVVVIVLLLGIFVGAKYMGNKKQPDRDKNVNIVVVDKSSPTPQVSPPPEAELEEPQEKEETTKVRIFLIALEDNGKVGEKIGCNDSVVPVVREVVSTNRALRASIVELLSLKDQYYGQSGLYNALYSSDLKLEGLTRVGKRAIIRLSGQILPGGECDNPRIEAQLRRTALQFPTISEVTILVNGKTLAETLSLK